MHDLQMEEKNHTRLSFLDSTFVIRFGHSKLGVYEKQTSEFTIFVNVEIAYRH